MPGGAEQSLEMAGKSEPARREMQIQKLFSLVPGSRCGMQSFAIPQTRNVQYLLVRHRFRHSLAELCSPIHDYNASRASIFYFSLIKEVCREARSDLSEEENSLELRNLSKSLILPLFKFNEDASSSCASDTSQGVLKCRVATIFKAE